MFIKKAIIWTTIGISVTLSACAPSNSHFQTQSFAQSSIVKPKLAFIQEKGVTLPPFGYVQFCQNNPNECPEQFNSQGSIFIGNETTASTASTNIIDPLKSRYNLMRLIKDQPDARLQYRSIVSLLDSVNREVNDSVRQVTDIEGFGVTENWRIPSTTGLIADIGDCEDFALAKRKILMERYGFNPNTLSMSVLRRPQGDIHAVLMVRTAYGDYVLDNIERDVLPWHETGYKWIKKQSFGEPHKWISL